MAKTTAANRERIDPRLAILGIVAVGTCFILGGIGGALGGAAIFLGVAIVRRARYRARRTRLSYAFQLLERLNHSIPVIRIAIPRADLDASRAALLERGWTTLEPPVDAPFTRVDAVGIDFCKDDSIWVRDIRSRVGWVHLEATKTNDVPTGWGEAAEKLGYVLVIAAEGEPQGNAWEISQPVTGTWALLASRQHAR